MTTYDTYSIFDLLLRKQYPTYKRYTPEEKMCGFPYAAEQADAIAEEFLAVLNKYIDSKYCCDSDVNYRSCQDYAMRLAADKVLSKLNETP